MHVHWVRLLGASTLCVAAPALAQDDPAAVGIPAAQTAAADEDTAIGEVVVTANRRETKLQDTALAISAFAANDLQERQINTIEALAPALPNVNFGKNVGFARIAIRGVGLDTTVVGQEGRVAYHTDGVYISRPTAAIATFFDIARVEVVRGPQGTLYGRNATAGAINVITNDPTQITRGYGRITVGNYGLVNLDTAIGGAVSDTVSARFAFSGTRRGGYGKNLNLGEDIDNEKTVAVRGKLKWEPAPGFSAVLSADYFYENDANFVYHYLGQGNPDVVPLAQALGGTVPVNPRNTFSDVPQQNDRRFYGTSLIMNADLGFATLTSITGFRKSHTDYRTDADGTNVVTSVFHIEEKAKQYSQELRLAGDIGSSLKYIAGLYYFSEDIYGNNAFNPLRRPAPPFGFAQGVDFRGNLSTNAYAAFGQVEYKIIDQLTLSVGARYSSERKAINHKGSQDLVTPYNPAVPLLYTQFQAAHENESSFTPRVGLEFRATPDILLYATYAKGFKSGGYNNNFFGDPLKAEKLTDYEGGIKAEFFDHRLRTNLAAFYYDYTNLQLQRIVTNVAIPLNAGKAVVKGLEAEIVAKPVRGLELSANAAYLGTKLKDFQTADTARPLLGVIDIEGNRLPQAPRYTLNLAAAYTFDLGSSDLTLRGEAAFTDKVFFSFYNRPEVAQGAYEKYNAFLSWESKTSGWNASLFIRNIGNRRTISSSQVSAGFSRFPIVGAYDPPRTYGGSVSFNF